MGTLTKIVVGPVVNPSTPIAVDNELIILAFTNSDSQELCHVKGGNSQAISYSGFTSGMLPSGNYSLALIGINWGGPASFGVTLTIDGSDTPYAYSNPKAGLGVVWNEVVQVTV